MSKTLEAFREQVKIATAYTNKIVVESDGYPMEHSAANMRTLLVNAFIAGMDSAPSSVSAQAVTGDWTKVTRFEVIGEGREYTRMHCSVEPSFQDDGRTLKVFIKPLPPSTDSHTENETKNTKI